ncbi:hypothetical protein VNO78_24227 [Psophocarpus tetragonolobus]|uniref:EDS1 EP domain-containing protein n=1 Tax=Psophocarpus tetragonolobus TaxID=3891 RepID=A0AAN9XEN5_PSOTE
MVESLYIAEYHRQGGKDYMANGRSTHYKRQLARKLLEFEECVYGSLKKDEVSPEVFLERSSHMKWWNQYMAIKGISGKPELAIFMSNSHHYDQCTMGYYDFP